MPITIGAKRESDFNDPIGMLSDCHRRIERFLQVLSTVTGQAQGAALTPEQREPFVAALRYFRESAPKHTADEEESLFPRLRSMENPEMRKLLERVDSLEQDHVRANELHAEVERLGQMWVHEGRLLPEEAGRLSGLLAELAELYREHIRMEDMLLFPRAAAALSASDREGIGAEMAMRRGLGRKCA